MLKLYTIDELASILLTSSRSISNYKDTGKAGKKALDRVEALYQALEANGWKKITVSQWLLPSSQITAEAILLQVLVDEFAQYKAKNDGLTASDIVKDIESKARLILTVSNKMKS